jgi:hypothetical protein
MFAVGVMHTLNKGYESQDRRRGGIEDPEGLRKIHSQEAARTTEGIEGLSR